MKKDVLIDKVKEIGLTKNEAKKVVDVFFDLIAGELKKGNTIKLAGFGKFFVKSRKERKSKNPKTGAEIRTPAKNTVSMKFSDDFKKYFHDKIGEGKSGE